MPGFVKKLLLFKFEWRKRQKIIKTKDVIVLSIIEFSLFFYNVDTVNDWNRIP